MNNFLTNFTKKEVQLCEYFILKKRLDLYKGKNNRR